MIFVYWVYHITVCTVPNKEVSGRTTERGDIPVTTEVFQEPSHPAGGCPALS